MDSNNFSKNKNILTDTEAEVIQLSPRDFVPNISITPFTLKDFYHNDNDKQKSYLLSECYYDYVNGTVRLASKSNSGFEKRIVVKVYRAECEGDLKFINPQRDETLKQIQNFRSNPSKSKNYFAIHMKSYKNTCRNLLHLNFEYLYPSFCFRLKKCKGVSLEETKLLNYIRSQDPVGGTRILPIETGYLGLNKKRELKLYLLDDTEELHNEPIVGFWIQNCLRIRSIDMLSHLLRFVLVKDFTRKVYQPGLSFYVVFFDQRNKSILYKCSIPGVKKREGIVYSMYNRRVEVDMMRALFSTISIPLKHRSEKKPILKFPARFVSKSVQLPKNRPLFFKNRNLSPPPSPSKIRSGSPMGSKMYKVRKAKLRSDRNNKKMKHNRNTRSLPPSPARPEKAEMLDLGGSLQVPLGGNGGSKNKYLFPSGDNYPHYDEEVFPKLLEFERRYPHRYPITNLIKNHFTFEKVAEEYAKLQHLILQSQETTHTKFSELKEHFAGEFNSMRNQIRDMKELVSKRLHQVESMVSKLEVNNKKADDEIKKIQAVVKDTIDQVKVLSESEKERKRIEQQKKPHKILWDDFDEDEVEEEDEDEIEEEVGMENRYKYGENTNLFFYDNRNNNNNNNRQQQQRHQFFGYGDDRRGGYGENFISRSLKYGSSSYQQPQIPQKEINHHQQKKKKSQQQSRRRSKNYTTDVMVRNVSKQQEKKEVKKQEEAEEENVTKSKTEDSSINKNNKKNNGNTSWRRKKKQKKKISSAVSDHFSSPSSTTTFPELPKIRVRGQIAESTISSLVDDEDVDDLIGGVSSESGFKTTMTDEFGDTEDEVDDDDSVFGQ